MSLDMLMNMFGGLGVGGFAVPNTPNGCHSLSLIGKTSPHYY